MDASVSLEVALSRARLVQDGGAFVEILPQPGTGQAPGQAGSKTAHAADHPPLAGLVVAVKDVFAIAGHPVAAGSATRDAVPPAGADADVVRALRSLGAIMIGRTALHEFAFGVTGVNDHTGTPVNPADASRIPGGSSSGSAVAVAVGAAGLGLGSDTGGSARVPAAFCGVVGFKPAQGDYPTGGLLPLSPTLDHVGFFAPTVASVRTIHGAFGHDVGRQVDRPVLGLVESQLEDADPEVRAAVRAALDRLEDAGATVVPVSWPGVETALEVSTAIMFAEAAAQHREVMATQPDRLGQDVRRRLEHGGRITAVTYLAAREQAGVLRDEVARALAGVDGVLGPTVPVVAPLLADAGVRGLDARLVSGTCLHNVTGTAAVSVPVPVPTDGLPVGLQVSGGSSAAALAVAAWVEQHLAGATPGSG